MLNIIGMSDEELNKLKLNISKEEIRRKNMKNKINNKTNDKEYIAIKSIEELIKLIKSKKQLYYKILNEYWEVDYISINYCNPSIGKYMISFNAKHMSCQIDENYGCWTCNMAGGGRNNIWSGYYMFTKSEE